MSRDAAYTGVNYPIQAEAARRIWARMSERAPYPLLVVPDPPGPRPPRWQWRARKRWQAVTDERNAAKSHNFAALYGSRVRVGIDVGGRDDQTVIILDDHFPFTWDVYHQMFPPGIVFRDERHTQTKDGEVE